MKDAPLALKPCRCGADIYWHPTDGEWVHWGGDSATCPDGEPAAPATPEPQPEDPDVAALRRFAESGEHDDLADLVAWTSANPLPLDDGETDE